MSDMHVHQEPDDVAAPALTRIALWTAAVFLVSAAGSTIYLQVIRGAFVIRAPETTRAPREISMVEQTLLREDRYARDLQREQRARLQTWARVPGGEGRVRIPMDEAIRLVVREAAR